MNRPGFIACLVIGSCLGQGAFPALAGPLAPPGGPILPTPGPEPRTPINATNTPGDADSVYRITAPGSYYLAGSITGEAGKSGIEVAASNVSIDLMGFSIIGAPGSEEGIVVLGVQSSIQIRTGIIAGWTKSGLWCDGTRGGVIEGITATNNGGSGIFAGDRFVVTRCVSQNNVEAGIRGDNSCAITDCIASGNAGQGIVGVFACTITGCVASGNDEDGIMVTGTDNVVSECSATSNGAAGILVLHSDSRIDSNNCTGNARGIHVTAGGNIVTRNTCSGSTTANYELVSGNAAYVVFATLSAPISGDFGGSPLSANPWVNFAY